MRWDVSLHGSEQAPRMVSNLINSREAHHRPSASLQLFSGVLDHPYDSLLFMLQQNIPITLVVVCITLLSLVVASFLAKRSYKYFQSQSTVRGVSRLPFNNEMMRARRSCRLFGHEAQSLEAFDEVNGRLQDVSLKAIFFQHD